MKRLGIVLMCLICSTLTVSAKSRDFDINMSDILSKDSRTNKVNDVLDTSYALDYKVEDSDNGEYENLTKKVTYLLLGDGDKSDESSTDYMRRKNDYLSLMYNPEIPKDENNRLGIDTESKEYKDSNVAGLSVPGMFMKLDDLNIRYNYFGNIKTIKQDDGFISQINIPNILMDDTNEEKPREYVTRQTNLTLYYIFKEYKGEYKLYYLYGETDDETKDYLDNNRRNEQKDILSSKAPSKTQLSELYDYSKLNKLSDEKLNSIYNSNINKVMILNTYYDKSIIDSATGFMLTDKILVTSWNYLKNSLINGQFIQISDRFNNSYDFDGVVALNEDADIVLLKINGYQGEGVVIGASNKLAIEDAVISLGTKSGMGISSSTGIVIAIDDRIQSLIPLQTSDAGGPLINVSGEVVGINTSLSTLSSVSYATKVEFLKDIQEKLSKEENIKVTSFDKLKELYYYYRNNEEIVKKELPDKIWNEFKKIGDLENVVTLPLVKASYKDKILSLRYKNEVEELLPNYNISNNLALKLKDDKYQEKLNSANKKIYENEHYKVVIMNEFNYLIVVMVKK